LDKSTLRKKIRLRISELDMEYIKESDSAILQNLISLPEFVSAPRVFTYLSIGREVDTRNFIEYCRRAGKQVALPADFDNGRMNFALLNCELSELSPGMYGIPIPDSKSERVSPSAFDIIVVPALCYDSCLYRLGRGGGYFDRYLSEHRVFSVGLCREALLVGAIPKEDFDVPVSCLVTEKRIARP